MDPTIITLIVIFSFIVLLLAGMPVFGALGMASVIGILLMQGPRGAESRQQEISVISRSLKSLAKELQVPILALSQLSRAVEVRGGDRRPQLSDLRESGALEQDADVVLFIYRGEQYNREDPELKNKAEVIIGKQRNGPTGTVHLTFLSEFASFFEPALEGDQPIVGEF